MQNKLFVLEEPNHVHLAGLCEVHGCLDCTECAGVCAAHGALCCPACPALLRPEHPAPLPAGAGLRGLVEAWMHARALRKLGSKQEAGSATALFHAAHAAVDPLRIAVGNMDLTGPNARAWETVLSNADKRLREIKLRKAGVEPLSESAVKALGGMQARQTQKLVRAACPANRRPSCPPALSAPPRCLTAPAPPHRALPLLQP